MLLCLLDLWCVQQFTVLLCSMPASHWLPFPRDLVPESSSSSFDHLNWLLLSMFWIPPPGDQTCNIQLNAECVTQISFSVATVPLNCSTYCWETAGIQPLAETPVQVLICQIEDAPLWLAKAQLPPSDHSFVYWLPCLSCINHIQLSQIRAPFTSYFSCTIQLELRRLAPLL